MAIVNLGAGFEGGHDLGQVVLVSERHAGIEKEKEIAEAVARSSIPGRRGIKELGAWAPDDAEAWTFRALKDGCEAVLREMIDDDDLVVRIVLVQETGKRYAQLVRPIHDADDDRHRLGS
jgi:hypothetical protein